MQEGGWLEVLEPLIPTALLHEGPRGQHPLLKDPPVGTGAQGCDLPIVTLVEPARVPRWVLASPARTADVLIQLGMPEDEKLSLLKENQTLIGSLNTFSKSAPSRSILLMKATRVTPYLSA